LTADNTLIFSVEPFINRIASYLVHRWNQRVRLGRENHAQLVALLALLRPMRAHGHRKIRVGSNRDGGYVMLDDFEKIDVALSLGIGPDVSWDRAIAERGIPVWQYDHTIAATPSQHPLFHFEPKRIVNQAASKRDLAFSDLLRQHGPKPFILKIDIESDEWEILAQLPPGLLANCRQIVIELHEFLSIADQAWRDRARQALLVLAKDFAVVHVHGNNLSKHIISGGLDLPDSLEVTFAHRRYYRLEPTQETFPGPADRKNSPYFPDFQLGRFQFPSDGEKL
jgi:hypothetical protein